MLVAADAAVNIADEYCGRSTALMVAVEEGHTANVGALPAAVAHANAAPRSGMSPLMRAAWRGNASVAEMLLEAGADVSAADEDGRSGLMWAAPGHAPIVEVLLAAGADVTAAVVGGS